MVWKTRVRGWSTTANLDTETLSENKAKTMIFPIQLVIIVILALMIGIALLVDYIAKKYIQRRREASYVHASSQLNNIMERFNENRTRIPFSRPNEVVGAMIRDAQKADKKAKNDNPKPKDTATRFDKLEID